MRALLILAHGSPRPEANEDILKVAALVRTEKDYGLVTIGYLDCNEPGIPAAIDECVSAGATTIVAVPYFLHSGRHLLRDVPALLREGAQRHGDVQILMGDYIGHAPQIAEILMDRVTSVGDA